LMGFVESFDEEPQPPRATNATTPIISQPRYDDDRMGEDS
jgi:hypothetical protein